MFTLHGVFWLAYFCLAPSQTVCPPFKMKTPPTAFRIAFSRSSSGRTIRKRPIPLVNLRKPISGSRCDVMHLVYWYYLHKDEATFFHFTLRAVFFDLLCEMPPKKRAADSADPQPSANNAPVEEKAEKKTPGLFTNRTRFITLNNWFINTHFSLQDSRWWCANSQLIHPQRSWWEKRLKLWTRVKGFPPKPYRAISSRSTPMWIWWGWSTSSAERWRKE